MKKTLLALSLALLSIASPAHALYNRVAVFRINSTGDPFASNRLRDRVENTCRILQDQGMPYDLIEAADTSRYGGLLITDEAWFFARYDAIIVPAMSALSNTATDKSNRFNLGFRSDGRGGAIMAAGNASAGPLSGTWRVPTYVWVFDVINNATVNFTCGITSILGGAQDLSTRMQMSTNLIASADGTYGDTVFVNTRRSIRDPTDLNVQVLLGGVNGKTINPAAAADTIALWKWRPDLAKPGVTYSCIREYDPNGTANPVVFSVGEAILLGQMYQVTGLRPPAPHVAWFDEDHVHPNSGTVTAAGRADTYNVRDTQALADSLRRWGWVLSGPIFGGTSLGNATLTSDNAGNGFVQDLVKQVVKDNEAQWSFHLHDHFDAPTNTWRASAQDTASVARPAYNLALATGQGPIWKNLTRLQAQGSFGFYETLPQDDGDWRTLKVYGDAGVRQIRGIGGSYLDVSTTVMRNGQLFVWASSLPVPWRAPGLGNPVVWVSGGATVVGSNARSHSQYIGGNYSGGVIGWMDVCFPIWFARGAAYFHGNENMQGISTAPTDWAPPILFLKHTKNELKLTWPCVQPMYPGNVRFKSRSKLAG